MCVSVCVIARARAVTTYPVGSPYYHWETRHTSDFPYDKVTHIPSSRGNGHCHGRQRGRLVLKLGRASNTTVRATPPPPPLSEPTTTITTTCMYTPDCLVYIHSFVCFVLVRLVCVRSSVWFVFVLLVYIHSFVCSLRVEYKTKFIPNLNVSPTECSDITLWTTNVTSEHSV